MFSAASRTTPRAASRANSRIASRITSLAAVGAVLASSVPAQQVPRVTAKVIWESPDDANVVWSSTSGMAVDAKQRVYVAALSESAVYVFGADGKYLTKFGRKGGGPGEFQRNCCIAFDAKGRLWVQDLGNARFVVFTIADNAKSVTATPAFVVARKHGDTNFGGVALQFDSLGRAFSVGNTPPTNGKPAVSEMTRYRLDSAGVIVDALSEAAQTENVSAPFLSVTKNGASTDTYFVWQPFGGEVLRAYGPNGVLALAGSSAYSVRWFDSNGKLLRTIAQKAVGPALTDAEHKQADSTLKADAQNYKTTVAAFPFGVPTRKPPISALRFDADGRLWVQRTPVAGAPREADVYSNKGVLLFTAVYPTNVRLGSSSFIRGNNAWGVALDSDEIPHAIHLEFAAAK